MLNGGGIVNINNSLRARQTQSAEENFPQFKVCLRGEMFDVVCQFTPLPLPPASFEEELSNIAVSDGQLTSPQRLAGSDKAPSEPVKHPSTV